MFLRYNVTNGTGLARLHVLTLVDIFAAVFWLGWMVFMFGLLRPVLVHLVPGRVGDIQGTLQDRHTIKWRPRATTRLPGSISTTARKHSRWGLAGGRTQFRPDVDRPYRL